MMKFLSAICCCLAILFGIPSLSAAETLKIGSMENFSPFNFNDGSGDVVGIDVDIIETVLSEMKLSAVHKPLPWKRAIAEFENGKLDILFQLAPTPERFEKYTMVGPIRSNNRAWFVRKDSELKDVLSLTDLDGLRVGTILGFSYPEDFTSASNFTKDPAKNISTNVNKLAATRLDIVLESEIPFLFEASKLGLSEEFRMLPSYAVESERWIAFQKSDRGRELGKEFQKKLDALHERQGVTSIIQKWQNRE